MFESFLEIVPYLMGLLAAFTAGWYAVRPIFLRAIETLVNELDNLSQLFSEAEALRKTLADAWEDNTVTQDEWDKIYLELDKVMKEIEELRIGAVAVADSFRELFGVIISIFKK